MEKEKRKLKNLKSGDLLKVSEELKVDYQKVKDVNSGRVKDDLIMSTLTLLNEERKKEALVKSRKAVKQIINHI